MKAHFFTSCAGALYDTRKPNWMHNPLRPDFAQFPYHAHNPDTSRIKAALRAGRYAFPGGYELFAIMNDGESVCYPCLKSNLYQVIYSTRHNMRDGWRVAGFECVANIESETVCAHCGHVINEDSEG